jgi:long-chain acyl-CoA synthetase
VTTYRTVPEMFLDRVAKTPDREAFQFPTASGWGRYTWKEVGDKVRSLACGLRALGLEDEQRVAIMATTRVEWVLADMAILCAGGATTTIYTADHPGGLRVHPQRLLDAVIAIVEDKKLLDKLAKRARPAPLS